MKAFVIAGGLPQIELLKQLKARGITTVLADGSDNCVARSYADVFYKIPIFDIEQVKSVAEQEKVDWTRTADICRRLFAYRKMQPWPPKVEKGEDWESLYLAQRGDLPILPSVDGAIAWANELIAKIDAIN